MRKRPLLPHRRDRTQMLHRGNSGRDDGAGSVSAAHIDMSTSTRHTVDIAPAHRYSNKIFIDMVLPIYFFITVHYKVELYDPQSGGFAPPSSGEVTNSTEDIRKLAN